MASGRTLVLFIAQSVAVGLAAAFVIVLLRPELANLERRNTAPAAPGSYAQAVAVSARAVVNIFTERPPLAVGNGRYEPGRRTLGSGVLIDPAGYVVTNWHVIADAEQIAARIFVELADGRIARAAMVGEGDPETELALLKIDLTELPSIPLGRSDSLAVGDVVLAIGNSLGLSQTVTMGIVSAVGRGQLGFASFENFIQTDAAINAGNSGGALVNTRGELVGINTVVIRDVAGDQRGSAEGLGFAIPVNLMRGVVEQLVAHGRVIRGFLGVDQPLTLSADQARDFGVQGPALLLQTVEGPAAAAGLRRGDILTHIGGKRIYSFQQAMADVASMPPGARVAITVVRRDGRAFTTEAVLEERPITDD